MIDYFKNKYKEYKFKKSISEYIYTFDLQEDEFNGNQILKFSRIGVMLVDKIWTYGYDINTFCNLFKFGFANFYGKDYVTFECLKKIFQLRRGDSINFLFSNNHILSFKLDKDGNIIGKDRGQSIVENRMLITLSELNSFMNYEFKKWKLISKNGNEILGGDFFISDSDNMKLLQYNIKRMSTEYHKAVKSMIRNYEPTINKSEEIDEILNKRTKISQHILDKVWNRDQGMCIICGTTESLEFDHIIPLSKGGANTYRNLQLLCEECNRKKSNSIG